MSKNDEIEVIEDIDDSQINNEATIDENINSTRLTFSEQVKINKDKNISIICDYLSSREDMKEKLEKENKTITGMYAYIKEQAKAKAINGCACLEDAEVFGLAVHYYDEDSIIDVLETKLEKPKLETTKHLEESKPVEKVKSIKKPKNYFEGQISLFGEMHD